MVEKRDLNPNACKAECEKYLRFCLEREVKFIQAEPLPKSTRGGLWCLDVEVGGRKETVRATAELPAQRARIRYPSSDGIDPDTNSAGVRLGSRGGGAGSAVLLA